MRKEALLLCILLLLGCFICGCAVDMSTKATPKACDRVKPCPAACCCPIKPVLAGTSENPLILLRHSDGYYYVINAKDASARKVGGIKPCDKPCKKPCR